MNVNKKYIGLSILVVIIIIICIILLLLNLTNDSKNTKDKYLKDYIATPDTKDAPIEIKETLEKVTVKNNYYTVKNCIIKFYTYYSSLFNKDEIGISKDDETIKNIENEKMQNLHAVYNILDENYKIYKNITLDNLENKLAFISTVTIDIVDMYVLQKNENINIYFVDGYLIDTSSKEKSKFSVMVNIDMLNRTYSIFLEDYIKQKIGNIQIGKNIENLNINNIIPNAYNTFKYQIITDEEYITDIFNRFRDNLIYNISEIYDNLDENYKQKRFPTLRSFEEYVNNKIKEISKMQLSKYKKTQYNNYVQYVCLADNNKYYIVNVFSPTEYKFILDTYTVDLPEFLEKYEKADEKTKVALNIEKIKEAINENDFKYVYDKLDETFKRNYYPDYNVFKEYLKENLFDKNTFEYKNIEKHEDLYVANIIVNETRKMNIILKLSEGTSFSISFNIEK